MYESTGVLILEHYSPPAVTEKVKGTVTDREVCRNSFNYSIHLSDTESKDIR